MRKSVTRVGQAAALAAIGLGFQAHAGLILDTTQFPSPFPASTHTVGNDMPGVPTTLYFGQLRATATGFVDFLYVGHEAGFTNTLKLNGASVHNTSAEPDNFQPPFTQVGPSLAVNAGELLKFGFCTDGGVSIATWGRCAYNDQVASLDAQYAAENVRGYRSIAFHEVSSFTSSSIAYGVSSLHNLWAIFWDDSGADNDDNHDDYVVIARFTPTTVKVPEPETALLLGTGLLAMGLAARRRRTMVALR